MTETLSAARVGIGGPVGSGKTALLERLIPSFARRGTSLAVITNDLVTREDAERLQRSGLIEPHRVMAVEAGACPHTVIREDPTLNLDAAERLEMRFHPLISSCSNQEATTSHPPSLPNSSTTGFSSSTLPGAATFRASGAPESSRRTSS